MTKDRKKFGISRWIFLALALLSNAFIIVYSCLSDKVTAEWNRSFTNFFASIINNLTHKEIERKPLEHITINLSDTYEYNHIPGYNVEEVPMGSAKRIECSFNPVDATNQSLVYSASPSDNVILDQSGSTLTVIGMKAGECIITGKSDDGGFESSVKVKVVEPVAPVSYEISLDNTDIAIGTTQTINFDIDGGVLTHDELINFRYYDTRKLKYSSSNEDIAKIDKYGVIYPQSVGTSTISVANGDYVKTINISVSDGVPPIPYSNLSISGSDVCYANDMILDQNSKKNHYQLTPKDGSKELSPEEFIWSSSNELLVKVDKHGVMRGFRKTSLDDANAIITAKSKRTGQEVTFNVIVKNQIPKSMNCGLEIEGSNVWNKESYTLSQGENIVLKVTYDINNVSRDININSSDESIVSFTKEGNQTILHINQVGNCKITVISVLNPELVSTFQIVVVEPGAISSGEIESFGKTIRKSLGHAAVFMVAQIFTYLTFYMFFHDKKWWLYSSISLSEGLFISGLSELIQSFVPSRKGTILDVLIDFAGVVVGALLTFLGILFVKKICAKRNLKEGKKRI